MSFDNNDNPFLANNNSRHSSNAPVASTADKNNEDTPKLDAQSIDPINISQIQHMTTDNVKNLNSESKIWDSLNENDPDVDDASVAAKVYKRRNSNKKFRVWFTILVCVIFSTIIIGCTFYLGTIYMKESEQPEPQPTQTTQTQETPSKYEDANNGGNPASADNVSYVSQSTNTNVTIDNKNVKLDGEKTLSTIEIPSFTANIEQQGSCALNILAATCYVGIGHVSEKTVDIFAFRDAAQSSLLMTDSKIDDLTVQGASIAYIQNVNIDGKQMKAIVIVAHDQSGIMIIGDDNTINAIKQDSSIRISSSSK